MLKLSHRDIEGSQAETGSGEPRFEPGKSGSRSNLLSCVVPGKGHVHCKQLSCSEPQFSLLCNGRNKSGLMRPFGRLNEVMPVEASYKLLSAVPMVTK